MRVEEPGSARETAAYRSVVPDFVTPGVPDDSRVVTVAGRRGLFLHMPPLGSEHVDDAGRAIAPLDRPNAPSGGRAVSLDVSQEGRLLVLNIDAKIEPDDVVTITRRLVEGAAAQRGKLAVLAIFCQGLHVPSETAKREMRANREAIRAEVAEVHVAPRGPRLLSGLGFLLGKAAQLSRLSQRLQFHSDEAHARQALRARGWCLS